MFGTAQDRSKSLTKIRTAFNVVPLRKRLRGRCVAVRFALKREPQPLDRELHEQSCCKRNSHLYLQVETQ